MSDADALVIRPAPLEQTLDLRYELLLAVLDGWPREEAQFPGDDDAQTTHFGAYLGDRHVGCATLKTGDWEGDPAWQLRGMATTPDVRGRGVGGRLLEHVEQYVVTEADCDIIWCNARGPAVGFYERFGWNVVSEEFDVPRAGPHFRMVKPLSGGA